jgi:predicted negative regulator of RcsB-dependent stress response
MHLKYYAVRSTVDLAQALINAKDYARAREELNLALGQSEKLGLRMETARIHYFLGEILRVNGNSSEAAVQFQQAHNILDDIKKEPGAEHLVDRSDLRDMYAAASRAVVAAK